MGTVKQRIEEIKQPRGGYIKLSEFNVIPFNDGVELSLDENINASLVGAATDYMTRFMLGSEAGVAFYISLKGAENANQRKIANGLLAGIDGLDDASIVNACKLVSFDVWYRSSQYALSAPPYSEINPNQETVENIRTMVRRNVTLLEQYGPVIEDGFDFAPSDPGIIDNRIFGLPYGGYTRTVSSGDGDFLTQDTLWDFKTTKNKPTSKHTLQVLMYWIMGQHSGQEVFRSITKIGIFNARLNTAYILDMATVSKDVIETVERDVICYQPANNN